ncbi:DoxX family protein [Candidatus Woesearchaeota archaeon CG10_big_fil_rev_8_21_14_0_10_32_24]|nr:MAG: DoxX family protein [Candidatus Woesearchaeota archaeon CG10_big_fil_rev_8_21_14_0_10_32_24]
MCIKKYLKGKEDLLYGIFKVIVGLMFFLHGWGKLFGAKAAPLMSLFGAAGVIEFSVGIMLVLGLWSRLGALIAGLEMLVAYFYMHIPGGFNPLANGGEASLLFFATFLIVLYHGNGKWNLEKAFFKKETF